FVTIGCMIKEKPQCQPRKAKRSRHDECRLPPILQTKPNDQRRGHYRTDRGSAIEDGHPKSTLANGKPLGHGLRGAGPVASFTESENKTKDAEARESARERMGHRRNGPEHDRTDKASFGSDSIVELS